MLINPQLEVGLRMPSGHDVTMCPLLLQGMEACELPPYAPYWTLAVTDAFAFSVNVQVFVLFPPLEHAPDQIASRPFVTLSVIAVPVLKVAEPDVPTATSMPAGLDITRSPLLPVAVTVNVAVVGGGGVVLLTVTFTTVDVV